MDPDQAEAKRGSGIAQKPKAEHREAARAKANDRRSR
jgi:hypothetical protein